MELHFNYKRSCSDVHELRLSTPGHNSHLSVTAGFGLSQTDSESESARRTPEQTCVTVSDPVLGTMRQACNYQVANMG
jgi:hypothetical protein